MEIGYQGIHKWKKLGTTADGTKGFQFCVSMIVLFSQQTCHHWFIADPASLSINKTGPLINCMLSQFLPSHLHPILSIIISLNSNPTIFSFIYIYHMSKTANENYYFEMKTRHSSLKHSGESRFGGTMKGERRKTWTWNSTRWATSRVPGSWLLNQTITQQHLVVNVSRQLTENGGDCRQHQYLCWAANNGQCVPLAVASLSLLCCLS